MKKLGICFSFFILICLNVPVCFAEEYTNYQEFVFENDDAKLLKYFTDEEYETYYQQVTDKKMFGWVLEIIYENEKVEFISETKLRIVNDGYSTIKHDISLDNKDETKFQISATGSIGIEVKGDVKKFKGNIDADIKATVNYTHTYSFNESYDFHIIVDPNTYVLIVTRGEGELTNGVAKNYFLWIETKKGGFETFCVTTEYYEIIKEKLS